MKRALLYILLAIGLTYGARELEYAGVRSNRQGEFAKLRECFLEKNNYDMIYVGSSRAESQYNPVIIDSATGLRSYNIGLLGATAPFMLAGLEGYLEKSTAPKYVVLNIDYHLFTDNPDTIHQFARYFPYLSNEALYKGLCARDSRFKWFRYVPFYSMPFFGTRYLNASVRGFAGITGFYDTLHVRGYCPVVPEQAVDIDTIRVKPYRSVPAPVIMESYERIAQICSEKNIRLILVISPLYAKYSGWLLNEDELNARFHAFAQQHHLPLLDYAHDPLGSEKALFADPAHLNKAGSERFSRLFAHDLPQYIRR